MGLGCTGLSWLVRIETLHGSRYANQQPVPAGAIRQVFFERSISMYSEVLTVEELKELELTVEAFNSYARLQILMYMLSLDVDAEYDKICDLVNLEQPSVSHHLRILRAANIVESYKKGMFSYYRFKSKEKRILVLECIDALRYLHAMLKS
jgi:ArsR family transcriptional regulator, arsenate/arsenite/antimonite-responsive transcriptional repressor